MTRIALKVGRMRNTRKSMAALGPTHADYVNQIRRQMKEIEDALHEVLDGVRDVAPAIMIQALYPTFMESLRVCPVDTKGLRDSAYLQTTTTGKKPRVEMGYSKNNAIEYAAYVHEILEYEHAEPTMAKFLEYPMMEDLDGIRARLESLYAQFLAGKAFETDVKYSGRDYTDAA